MVTPMTYLVLLAEPDIGLSPAFLRPNKATRLNFLRFQNVSILGVARVPGTAAQGGGALEPARGLPDPAP